MSQQEEKKNSLKNLDQTITLLGKKMNEKFLKIAKENKLKRQQRKEKQAREMSDLKPQDTSFTSLQLPKPKEMCKVEEKLSQSFTRKKPRIFLNKVGNTDLELTGNFNDISSDQRPRDVNLQKSILESLSNKVDQGKSSIGKKKHDKNFKVSGHEINLKNKSIQHPKNQRIIIKRKSMHSEKMESRDQSESIASQKTPSMASSESWKASDIKDSEEESNKIEESKNYENDKFKINKNLDKTTKTKTFPKIDDQKESCEDQKQEESNSQKKHFDETMKLNLIARRRRKAGPISSDSESSEIQKKERAEIEEINRKIAQENESVLKDNPKIKSQEITIRSNIKIKKDKDLKSYDFFKNGLIKEQNNYNQNPQENNEVKKIPSFPNQNIINNNNKKINPAFGKELMFTQENKIKENTFQKWENSQNSKWQNPFENPQSHSGTKSILTQRNFEQFQDQGKHIGTLHEQMNWFQIQINMYNQFLKSVIIQNQLFAHQMNNFMQSNGHMGTQKIFGGPDARFNGMNMNGNLSLNGGLQQSFGFQQNNFIGNGLNRMMPNNWSQGMFIKPFNNQMGVERQNSFGDIKENNNIFAVTKKSKDKFIKLEKILKKIFLIENMEPSDLELDDLEKWIFQKVIEKKKYFLITRIVWSDVKFFDELKASTTPKRNEEKLKYVFKMTQKKLKKKFFQHHFNYCNECKDLKIKELLKCDKEFAFFHYYFSDYCKENNIPLKKIIHASGNDRGDSFLSSKKNIRAIKSVNREYLKLIKNNKKFMDQFKKYILFETEDLTAVEETHNSIIGDSYATIQKKIENKVAEWTSVWYNSEKRVNVFKQNIENDFNKKKYKLPWTMVDVYSAVDEVRQIIREEEPNYEPEKFE
jgi:hypothetical protein